MGKRFRTIQLFLQLVWRTDWVGGRISISTAWEVSANMNGLKQRGEIA